MAIRNFLIFLIIIFSAATASAGGKAIIVYGDSLISGYGLNEKDSFPVKLWEALKEKHPDIKVINHGMSGARSADAKTRLLDVVTTNPDLVILEFGSNDIMHNVPAERLQENLDYLISEIKAKTQAKILLCGISAKFARESNDYGKYKQVYKDLAKKHDIALFSDFLDGVAGKFDLNQQDLIHPNEKGVDVIVKNILPEVKDLIE